MNILAPEGWAQLNFLLDPRTGLSRFSKFSTSQEELLKDMMVYCRRHPIEEIPTIPAVEERLHLYLEHEEFAEMQLRRCGQVKGPVIVADLRNEDPVYACNRFTIYAVFPECSVSIHVLNHSTRLFS